MSVKAFECVPVIESAAHVSIDGKCPNKIECIECCGKELFIGTSDGYLVAYLLEEKIAANGKITYMSKKIRDNFVNVKKAIKTIKAASALNRLLVLCNSSLVMLDMDSLEIVTGASQLQGITKFCVNENPNVDDPFTTQICVADRKKLKIINVNDKKFNLVTEITESESPKDVAIDGPFICVAFLTQYKVYNFETKSSQDLFEFQSDSFVPVIRRITKGEFLLTAPGNLGMFVTAEGVSNRPPIQWSCQLSSDFSNPGILALAYFHPYVLGLSNGFIMIYSILDQQQKQSLPFNGGLALGNFDGRLYLSTATSVFSLCPIPWETQVKALLADKRVDEALALAENSNRSGVSKDQYEKIYQNIQKQAAFIYFSVEEFDKAKEMFINSQVDIREVISLFRGLLPQHSSFMRTAPPLHDIADVDQLFHRDQTKLKQATYFLQQLLEEVRNNSPRLIHQYEIDTALLKLYSQSNLGDLEAFIVAGEIDCDIKDCLEWLEKNKCYHSLALLYRHSRNHEMALKIWAQLVSEELVDDSFQGLEFFVECLSNIKDLDLVWSYATFVLQKDEKCGVKMFTNRPLEEDRMKPDNIVEFLQQYPHALISYLEDLVFVKKVMQEKFHTHLALLYLENIAKMKKNSSNEQDILLIRKKFQHFLQDSSLYRIQLLLGKIKGMGLDQEAATLHGKVGEHEKALNILVHRLKDYEAAENYCEANSKGKDIKVMRNIYHALLSCYLNPNLETDRRNELIGPALELLNKRAFVFDSSKVLEILPPEWSITVVSSFLRGAVRASVHQFRMRKVEAALARGENLQRRFALHGLQHNSIVIQESNYCCVCKKPFMDGAFARYPNNVITHIACAKQNDVCPLTGKVFKSPSR